MAILRSLLLALFVVASSGCLYLNTKVPLDTDVSVTTLGPKVGTSTMRSVLWLVAWGDSGTEAAAKNGNITKINHMDRKIINVLFGAYAQVDTIVYGD